jgi:hypothetical protein
MVSDYCLEQVKQALAMCFLVLFPYYSSLHIFYNRNSNMDGPLEAWREAIEFAGTSFIIDSIMPSDSIHMPGAKVEEELLQALALVSILHAVLYAYSTSKTSGSEKEGVQKEGDQKDGAKEHDIVGSTLESIGSFTTWRVGRRFSNILDAKLHVDVIQLLSGILVLLALVRMLQPLVGKSFPKIANDLLVMIAVIKLASSAMFVFQQGYAKDAIILLFSGMVAIRLIIHIFI